MRDARTPRTLLRSRRISTRPPAAPLEIFQEPKVVVDNSLKIGQMFTVRGRNRRSDPPRSSPFEEYVSISIQIDARDQDLRRTRNTGEQGLPIRGPRETVDPPPLWQGEIPFRAILQIDYADLFPKLGLLAIAICEPSGEMHHCRSLARPNLVRIISLPCPWTGSRA